MKYHLMASAYYIFHIFLLFSYISQSYMARKRIKAEDPSYEISSNGWYLLYFLYLFDIFSYFTILYGKKKNKSKRAKL